MQIRPGKVGSSGERLLGSAIHLLRLSRGLTPAVIQDVAFSACGTLLTVSSARGTTHIYRLTLPGECHLHSLQASSSKAKRNRQIHCNVRQALKGLTLIKMNAQALLQPTRACRRRCFRRSAAAPGGCPADVGQRATAQSDPPGCGGQGAPHGPP